MNKRWTILVLIFFQVFFALNVAIGSVSGPRGLIYTGAPGLVIAFLLYMGTIYDWFAPPDYAHDLRHTHHHWDVVEHKEVRLLRTYVCRHCGHNITLEARGPSFRVSPPRPPIPREGPGTPLP